jgi:hypothetical protein
MKRTPTSLKKAPPPRTSSTRALPSSATKATLLRLVALSLCALAACGFAASGAASGQEENRYAVAGVEDPREVGRFLSELKEAVARDERARVASLVSFPMRLNSGRRKTLVRDRRDFLRRYARIFNAKVREALARQAEPALFVNYQGVMVGDGEIWFAPAGRGSRLKVITVNN